MVGRNYVVRGTRVVVCIAVIISVFYLYLPTRENRIERMNATVGENHIDILCIGSSHMTSGVNPIQMYTDYGYAAYIVAGGAQAPWQNYYYLKEALETQTPSIVILDVYKFGSDQTGNSYKDSDTINNMLDTPLSMGKIASVCESVANNKLDVILRFPYIYNDYESISGITVDKFYGNIDYSMGYSFSDYIETGESGYYNKVDARDVSESMEISTKNEYYLRKIIEFCNERDIDIILINAPWPAIQYESQMYFNYIATVAEQYGVPFIDGDMLWNELEMDWTTDSSGNYGHLNHFGVTKFTSYVERYIHDNYNLPDRRNDDKYVVYSFGSDWLDKVLENKS